MRKRRETGPVGLDQGKLLGFGQIASFGSTPEKLRRALDATHTKIGEVPPPTIAISAGQDAGQPPSREG